MTTTIKTRTVRFTYGTARDAELQIPAEPASLLTVVHLIRESLFRYMMRGALVSDAVVVSSIGTENFLAGALGGWETRLPAAEFKILSDMTRNPVSLAVAVAQFRNPHLTLAEAYTVAAHNEALSEEDRKLTLSAAEFMTRINLT